MSKTTGVVDFANVMSKFLMWGAPANMVIMELGDPRRPYGCFRLEP
jgi:hypothetical protein